LFFAEVGARSAESDAVGFDQLFAFWFARLCSPANIINFYSPTSGSKERNIQTYKYGEKATKEKNRKKNSEQV